MAHDPDTMTYGRYLALDDLLSAQHPISGCHDEMLFVIIHQTKELWLKQIIFELEQALGLIAEDALVPAYKGLARVSRIQAVMTLSWDVLATMTPADYSRFRSVLGTSSGFQSAQFRQVEFMLGLKDSSHLNHQSDDSAEQQAMRQALAAPSLWDEANRAAARAGLPIPAAAVEQNWAQPYESNKAVENVWATVYRDTETWWELYQLAEKLVDIDDAMASWRHKHVVTVERVIGGKRGTGGTAGVPYLQSTLAKRAFPELWSLRTQL